MADTRRPVRLATAPIAKNPLDRARACII